MNFPSGFDRRFIEIYNDPKRSSSDHRGRGFRIADFSEFTEDDRIVIKAKSDMNSKDGIWVTTGLVSFMYANGHRRKWVKMRLEKQGIKSQFSPSKSLESLYS